MIATGSSPDAFQATSYLDLCPLNCSLPSSPPAALSEKLQNQHWRRWHLKIPPRESCQLGSCFSRVQNNISQSHQVRSISLDLFQLTKFRSYLWDPKRTSIQQKMSWMWIVHNAETAAIFAWALSFCRPPSERNYISTCHKMMLVSECCGLIACLDDAAWCLQPPVVFRIFEADAGHVRSLTW